LVLELTAEDLLALVESARDLSSEIDLAELLEHLLERAGALTGSEAGSVILFDPDRPYKNEQDELKHGALYFAAATGKVRDFLLTTYGETGPESVPPKSKAGQVHEIGRSMIIDAVAADPEHFKGVDQATKHTTESMVCVPLRVGTDRLGVVQLLNKHTGNYTERDRVLLEHFASHAAIAIRNARLFTELLAHKGLYTSRSGGRRTQDLVAQLNAAAHRERLTVLFADMRGFTELTNVVRRPEEVVDLLNGFLKLLAGAVMREDGVVNKFLGDGVLAFFGGAQTEHRAVRAAFDILDGFDRLRLEWQSNHRHPLTFVDVGVGIVTDEEVIIGAIGSGRVKDFTVIGSAVNLAAAFEHDARQGRRVLVDQPTFQAARDLIEEFGDREPFELRKPDQQRGVPYWRYHIKRLKPRPGVAVAVVADSGDGMLGPDALRPYYENSWAIVIGIDTYHSKSIRRLSYAARDAQEVAEALPGLGFERSRIDVLLNEQATSSAIRDLFSRRASQMGDRDRVLVFFAGHGEVHNAKGRKGGFLQPYDVVPTNLAFTSLAMNELTELGHNLPAKHVLFVLDTCFSGFAGFRGSMQAAQDLGKLTAQDVVQVLSAGNSEQQAAEEGGHGIFTKYFLQGLRGDADPTGTGLTALKLAAYVEERVRRDTQDQQTPQYSKLRGEGEFLFRPPR
jgi:class 3 adenylate cyclase